MIGRIVRTDLRHGTPPLVALLAAVATAWMLAVHPEAWAGQWTGLSTYFRVSLLILLPVMVAGGAWRIGRERRAQLDELLATTPRPEWQPMLAAWMTVTLGGLAGVVVPLAAAMALIGPRATHVGDGWWWTLLVGLVALSTAAALGVLLGRFVPLRLVAPVAGVSVYLGLAVPIYLHESPWTRLSPVIGYAGPADVWPAGYHAWQAGWLVALGAVLFLLAARRWVAAALPGLIAFGLLMVPARAGADFGEAGTDAGAVALVCTGRAPQVCVTRVHGFLLDEVAAVLEPQLRRLAGVPGAPVRAVDALARPDGERRDDTVWVSLTQQAGLSGKPAEPGWLRAEITSVLYDNGCPPAAGPADGVDAADETLSQAWNWLQGIPAGLPDEREKEWIGRVLAAARACDRDGLRRLVLS
jgi:hypothetical protein